MNVLLVTYEYPPDVGGVSAYLEGLFGALPEASVLHLQLPKRKFGWLWQLPKIWMAARKADMVVISHLLPLGTTAMLMAKPFVAIVHGLDLRSAALKPLKKRLASFVLKRARHIVANSQATASELAGFGIDPAKALVLTPCLSDRILSGSRKSDESARSGIRSKLGLEGKKILLSVGRFIPRKGFDRLIRLLPELRNTCGNVFLMIAGRGPEENALRREVKRLGLDEHVRFVIAPDTDVLAVLYRAADVFALAVRASKEDVEGFGIVFLEAALFGLPVVSTRVGGISEAVIDGLTGILVEPDSEEDLLVALRRLLNDSVESGRLGAAGQARVRADFAWKTRAQELMKRLI